MGVRLTNSEKYEVSETDIAVIGMAGRFPGARTPDEYWRNIRDGVESIRRYNDEELREAGVKPELLHNPNYVKAGAPLDDMELFDAEFFGFSPKDAAIMDPQHRQLLECAWEALEDAGHPPESFAGPIGVYAGCGMNAYMMFNLLSNPELMESVGLFLVRHTGNDKDFLSTRISYSLNLTGPSINVQTACSTSLVAIHIASQNLLSGECDMALAGGVTIEQPHRRGYLYEEGEILSPDGHCRSFDHRSRGTVFGSGAGLVVLRRLADAIADGDHIYAVIKGSAINNDGSNKVGYLAPSVDGQAKAIAEALAVANVDADSIQYIETHGTGTPVGDPIEIAALTQAFRGSTDRKQFCRIGSVKTNIGHLDTAAGVASFIKVCQALRHAQMPPSLHFEAPNPNIDFASSPFVVNASLRDWPRNAGPKRAGISSLGVGGTNAHIIAEEAPTPAPSGPSRDLQLLTLSGRNPAALEALSQRMATWLREHPQTNFADVAWTLHVGRREFDQRRTVVACSASEAADALDGKDATRVVTRRVQAEKTSVVFLFPGGGAQHPRMGIELYEHEPIFRQQVDRGLVYLRENHGLDLAPLLFPSDADLAQAAETFHRPSLQLPAIFIIEIATVALWKSWGIHPAALIGHSMGENTAACIAGVMRYEDALGLVALRGKLFERIPPGGMLSIPLPAAELAPLLSGQLALASVNGPSLSVASGPNTELDALAHTLAARGIETQRIKIDIAAHSSMLDPILPEFGDYLRRIPLSAPEIPFASNLTGTWITPEQATDPEYWVRHLRGTVRFADGIATLLEQPGRVLLEVGPGKTLASIARQNEKFTPGQLVLSSLRHPDEPVSDLPFLLGILGRLWTAGVAVDWPAFHQGETRRRVSLPTYAFQHQRYWIAPGETLYAKRDEDTLIAKTARIEDWFYRPIWRQIAREAPPVTAHRWLVFVDQAGIGTRVAERLRAAGDTVLTIREGDAFYRISATEFALAPEEGRTGYDALLRELSSAGQLPDRILHLWALTEDERTRPGSSFFHHMQERGFYSLLFLAQALGDLGHSEPIHFCVVTNGAQQVGDEPLLYPVKAALLGPCLVIPQEFPNFTCINVDVELPDLRSRFGHKQAVAEGDRLVERLVDVANGAAKSDTLTLRKDQLFEQGFERSGLDPLANARTRLRDGGTYLVTGGLGGIGLVIAEHLAHSRKARLVLVGREELPERHQWATLLASPTVGERTRRKLRRLIEIEAAGAEVMTAAADVADLTQMGEIVAKVRQRFGPIHGVFHAAGILDDDLIQLKTQAAIDEVLTPKIQGTFVLDQLLGKSELDFMVLFSSTSSLLGAAGQVDYVAANSFLNAFAQSRARAKGPCIVAIQWGVWASVGMAADAAARDSAHGPLVEPPKERAQHPLLDFHTPTNSDEIVFESVWSARDKWILDEHRTLAGQALLPGTGYIELARAALAECGMTGPLQIDNLAFISPLAVDDREPRAVRVNLHKSGDSFSFRVESRAADTHTEFELHAQGLLSPGAQLVADSISVDVIRARCMRSTPVDPGGIRTRQEDHVSFGPRWRSLRQVHWGENEALAELELPAIHAGELSAFQLHPALLDIATGYAMELVLGYGEGASLYVPMSYQRIRVHGPLVNRVVSWVRGAPDNQADKEIASFDIVIADETGRVLFEVEQFTVRKIDARMNFAASTAKSADAAQTDAGAHLSPAQRNFRQTLAAGILPEEGVAVLERVLAAEPRPQVIASSIDLEWLVRQMRAATPAPKSGGQKFSRPNLSSEYKAPGNEIESELVDIWEELLGVDQVGVQDDFFELGGHSLIAVRLFAQLKKRFGVDYPISVLFKAPTIEKCAALVETKIGAEGAAAVAKPGFDFLVPMHTGNLRSTSAPFFLVAGMFGNVLNLRHLASLVGRERRFYAIQARGLRGDEEPHQSFAEMAQAYLAEVREVQPHGPYFLGGFSGGGISAYEMAQQLRAAGEQVALVVLLDTPLAERPRAVALRDKLTIHRQRLLRHGLGYPAEWLRNRIHWELANRRNDDDSSSAPYEFRSRIIEKAFNEALTRYEMKPYDSPLVLFRPKLAVAHLLAGGRIVNEDRQFLYPDNGWTRYAEAVEVHEVPGNHDSMVLEPNVRVLASRLREALQRAEQLHVAPPS